MRAPLPATSRERLAWGGSPKRETAQNRVYALLVTAGLGAGTALALVLNAVGVLGV